MTIRGPFAFVIVTVLVLSLAANFLVLGFAAARFHGFDEGAVIERIVSLGTRAFPRELRRQIGDALGRHRGELRGALHDVQEARKHMLQVMAAEPFDRAALDAAFAEVRARTETLQRLGQELVGDVVAEATPEERSEIRPQWFFRR
jgi:uncharacterized membrane protein